MTTNDQTGKARQVKTEKRTIEDVLRALQDLVGNELAIPVLAPPVPVPGDHAKTRADPIALPDLETEPPIPTTRSCSDPEMPPFDPQGTSWDEGIPVLRDVVLGPGESEPTLFLDAQQARDLVQRAVRAFNARVGKSGTPLSPVATELLEHLLFEEWVRSTEPDSLTTGEDHEKIGA